MFVVSKNPFNNWSKLKIGTIGVLSGCIILYDPIKDTIGINRFEKKFSLISGDGKKVRLPMELHEFADDLRRRSKIKDKVKAELNFYLTKELDVNHLGNLNLSNGAKVGVPYTYTFKKVEEVDPTIITSLIGSSKLKSDDWHQTENGKKLLNSLILSQEAKKFAIAKEIMVADCELPVFREFVSVIVCLLSASVYHSLEPRTISLIGKIPATLTMGLVISVFVLTVRKLTLEIIEPFFLESCDYQTLTNVNSEYQLGAPEYYQKLIERNKSLRALLTNGPQKYDADGNPIGWFQYSFTSLQQRLDKCNETIIKWKETQQSTTL